MNGMTGRATALPTPIKILIASVGMVAIVGVLAVSSKALWHEITKERPKWNSGTVLKRDFSPAHNETRTRWNSVYTGESCTTSGYGSTATRVCTPNYIDVPEEYIVFVPDTWKIQIQNCAVTKKDGSYWRDKKGNNKCFKKWVRVGHDEYDSAPVGSEWSRNA